jgi:hypothetical protein
MAKVRSGVAALMGAALANPTLSATSGPAGSRGPTARARTLQAQSWAITVSDCNSPTPFARRDGWSGARAVLTTGWDGRRGAAPANPGVYDIVLASRNRPSVARGLTWSYVVNAPAPGPAVVGTAVEGSGGLVPLPPVRLLDSRTGPALATGPGGRVDLAVTGRGGIPADGVLAVVLQVTALCPSASTSLAVWPAGRTRPAVANVALPARGARTATVVVPVGAQGLVSLGNAAGVTGLLVDAVGYTTASGGAALAAVPNTRVLDSGTSGGPLLSGNTRTVTVPTIAGVGPDRMQAVLAQIRLRGAAAAGSVTITGAGQAPSAVATARYEAGADTVTLAVLRPEQGRLVVSNSGAAVSVLIDVVGLATADAVATVPDPQVTSGQLTALTPTRVYDSRVAGAGGALAGGATRQLTLAGGTSPVPADARAVLVSLSATAGTAAATATVWATGAARPARADLALGRGGSNANLVLVPLGPGGIATVGTEGGLASFAVNVVGYLS